MPSGRMLGVKKRNPEDTQGEVWQSTMLDMDSLLRMARGIGTDETLASTQVFSTLKRRGHPDGPPPTISDGWGGIDNAMLEDYGIVPEYQGRGRPPSRKQPQPGREYLQMAKLLDEHGKLECIHLRAIYGKKAELIALMEKVPPMWNTAT